jgi:hypothetical protein
MDLFEILARAERPTRSRDQHTTYLDGLCGVPDLVEKLGSH